MKFVKFACALGVFFAAALTNGGTQAQSRESARPAKTTFVQFPGRVDVAYDAMRHVLYVSAGEYLQRYDVATGAMLTPLHLGGAPYGLDISPDGNTLASANGAVEGATNFVDLVDLATQTVQRRNFALEFYEGSTFTVAYDAQGKLLVSSRFQGSGWVPLRKLDPSTGAVTTLGSVRQDSMLSASPERKFIGVTESNISNGPYGFYKAGDTSYASSYATNWFTWEIAVGKRGKQAAIPTYGGTQIHDPAAQWPAVGEYAGTAPIGAAYSPNRDLVYFPMANSNYVSVYDTTTMTESSRIKMPGTFSWTGNSAFAQGRAKVSSDGGYLFVTVADGVAITPLTRR